MLYTDLGLKSSTLKILCRKSNEARCVLMVICFSVITINSYMKYVEQAKIMSLVVSNEKRIQQIKLMSNEKCIPEKENSSLILLWNHWLFRYRWWLSRRPSEKILKNIEFWLGYEPVEKWTYQLIIKIIALRKALSKPLKFSFYTSNAKYLQSKEN